MASLAFHRSLYPPQAVESAVAAYADLARFEVDVQEHQTTVTIADIDPDFATFPEEFADSFANHALFEAIGAHRAGSPA